MLKLSFKRLKLKKGFTRLVDFGIILQLLSKNRTKPMPKFTTGFTLIETLVAIFILAMSITSAMTVVSSSLQASFYARDRIAAYFLAQEAIEMIKNKRDENGIKNYQANPSVHWLDDIADWATISGPCGDGSVTCGPDSYNDIIVNCSNFDNCLMYQDKNGIFLYLSGVIPGNFSETKFTRIVNMEKINEDEAKVTVKVSWPGRDFTVAEHILNWHPLSTLES